MILQIKVRPALVSFLLAAGLIPGCAGVTAVDKRQIGAAFGDPAFCNKQLKGEAVSRTELFFGLSRPDGSVISDDRFRSFIENEVAPRFPGGFTLLAGAGQFKDRMGAVIREPARILILLYPFSRENHLKIESIRTAYQHQFRQQSVLRSDQMSCISF